MNYLNFLFWLSKTVLIVLSLTLFSCEKDDMNIPTNLCEVQQPTQNISWLKEAIDDARNDQYSYYSTAIYQGERVFFYGNCDPAVGYVSFIRNCVGKNLGNMNELNDELEEIQVVWRHQNSKCNF